MRDYPTVSRSEGSYDFCHPSEKQAMYSFALPEGAPKRHVCYDVEIGGDADVGVDEDVLFVARAMLAECKTMLYSGHLEGLQALVEYLETNEARHEVARWAVKLAKCAEARLTAEGNLESWKRILAEQDSLVATA